MLWFRFVPSARQEARNTAATDHKINALQSHQDRALAALDRELELFRLSITAKDPRQ